MKNKATFKRYMVFIVVDYEAHGGLDDCESSYDMPGDAVTFARGYIGKGCAICVFDRVEGVLLPVKP